MRKSNLCILACCVGIVWGGSVRAQDDQAKALDALHQAEAKPAAPDNSPDIKRDTSIAPLSPAPADTAPAPSAPTPSVTTTAPAPAPVAAPVSADNQTKALEALRAAEVTPVSASKIPASATSSDLSGTAAVPPTSLSSKELEARLVDIQTQRKAAQDKVAADRAALDDSSKRQLDDDDLKVQQANAAQKAAAEQARADHAAYDDAVKRLEDQDGVKVKEATEAERIATEQLRMAREQEAAAIERERVRKAQQEAALAAERKRAQDEEARRVARMEKDLKERKSRGEEVAPQTPVPVTEKERKLADLLRRYQADEITPYEYHLQRAKLIAEP